MRFVQCNLAIFGEQMQMLQVVLLQILHYIVHMHRADHETQRKHGGTIFDCALRVESALCVH